jgi:hypothetical protein
VQLILKCAGPDFYSTENSEEPLYVWGAFRIFDYDLRISLLSYSRVMTLGSIVTVPDSCASWADQMSRGPNGEPRILSNVVREKCTSDAEPKFFDLLAKEGNPGSAVEAQSFSANVVGRDESDFLFQGRSIPSGHFEELLRLQRVGTLRYCLPESFLSARGISRSLLERLTVGELNDLLEGYSGSGEPGGMSSVVWVTDGAAVRDLIGDCRAISNRLGLRNWEHEKLCVIITFGRDRLVTSLHVPRVFEGINDSQFELEVDCAALRGTTKPISEDEDGLPEAVYRKTNLKPISIGIGVLV